jgi:DNA-directed RNA polymerase subunit RPC12/RpoP
MTNYCIDCGRPITDNRVVRCRVCNGKQRRTIQANQRRFRHRAAQTTQRQKVLMAQRQTVRLCEMAEERT